MIRTLPLNAQTLYADLAQKLIDPPAERAGSISRRGEYLYAVRRDGLKLKQTFLGRADDPDAMTRADAITREAQYAKARRNTISMLKRAGLSGPTPQVGRIMDRLSSAGLFDNGLVLVGTVAFQCYPAILGCRLSASALQTQDADFVVATTSVTVAIGPEAESEEPAGSNSFLALLQQVDPSFRGAPQLDRSAPPSRFRADDGFDIELLTPVRTRGDQNPVRLPALAAGAIPLHFLEFLIEDATPAVALYGSGVRVRIPQPARYAVHKLIVAQRRDPTSAKKPKDLEQARALFEVVDQTDPDAIEDALDDACSRGRKWSSAIETSLRALGMDGRI